MSMTEEDRIKRGEEAIELIRSHNQRCELACLDKNCGKPKNCDDCPNHWKIINDNQFGYSSNFWHQLGALSDGARIGTVGSMTHIINNDNYAISSGYHEIEALGEGKYMAKSGSGKYTFRCDDPSRFPRK